MPTLPAASLPHDHSWSARVYWSTGLWSAGHLLTSGGFLTYFAAELGASAPVRVALLTAPELVGIAGLGAHAAIRWCGGSKRTWLGTTILSLVCLAIIPALVGVPHAAGLPASMGLLVACWVFRSIGLVAWLDWLRRLAPAESWGRFFGRRQMVHVAVLVVPVLVGYLSDQFGSTGSRKPATPRSQWVTGTIFYGGIVLAGAATAVMWRVPETPGSVEAMGTKSSTWQAMQAVFANRAVRRVVLFHWAHAAASGMTQAAFFEYRRGPLAIGLGTYYLLESVMRIAQLPVCAITGRWSDRIGHRIPLAMGCLVTALSLVFWIVASHDNWRWLFVAYVMWGGWGAINVAGPNLLLQRLRDARTAPDVLPTGTLPLETAVPIALSQNVAGGLAGLAGMAGGWWLHDMLARHATIVWGTWRGDAFTILFASSMCARLLCLVWLRDGTDRITNVIGGSTSMRGSTGGAG